MEKNIEKGIVKMGFIGCGNFGGQLADALVKEGFPCVAINAARSDLENLSEEVVPFLVGDGYGTGKDRDKAKEYLEKHLGIMEDDVFCKFISDNDVIVIGASAGGGFGSGIAPILAYLIKSSEKFSKKCVRVVTTLPSLNEQYTPQKHAEDFLKELLCQKLSYIVYDNEKFNKLEAADMNEKIISKAVEDMKILRGDYVLECTTGGIDHNDLMALNNTPGRTVCSIIHNLDESMIEDNSLIKTIKNKMTHSADAPLVDDKISDSTAMMYNLTSDTKKYAPAIPSEAEEEFGIRMSDFKCEVVDNNEVEPFICYVVAGLTEPTTRIDKIISLRVAAEKKKREQESHRAQSKLNTIEPGALSLSSKSDADGKAQSAESAFANFNKMFTK